MLHGVRHGAEEADFEALEIRERLDGLLAPEIGVAHAVTAQEVNALRSHLLTDESVDSSFVVQLLEIVEASADEGGKVARLEPAHVDGASPEEGARVGNLNHIRLHGGKDFRVFDQLARIMQRDVQPAAGSFTNPLDERRDDEGRRKRAGRVVTLELPVDHVRSRGLPETADNQKAEKDRRGDERR